MQHKLRQISLSWSERNMPRGERQGSKTGGIEGSLRITSCRRLGCSRARFMPGRFARTSRPPRVPCNRGRPTGRSPRRGARLVMAGGVNYNGVWAGLGVPFPRSTYTKIHSMSRAPTPPASSGRSAPRSSAGRSATKSSSIVTRTTATTRIATGATRCCRHRSASGVTRLRTAPSRNSAACSRAN